MPKKINFIKDEGTTYALVADLHRWKDNPKDVEGADYKRLLEQIKLGEHSTMLVTTEGEVLGGNTRLRAYQELKKERAKVIVVDFVEKDGVVHAFVDGLKVERTFDSVNQAKLEYAISHNDAIGKTNEKKLAQLLHVTPIPMEVYKINAVVRPIEDVAFEHGAKSQDDPANRPLDEDNTATDKLDSYLNGAIKQIVLYFKNDQYVEVIDRLEHVREEDEDNTALFMKMLEHYENSYGA